MPLAARTEIGSRLESQRNSAVALDEFFAGKLASARGRVIEIKVAAVEPFENDEVAELPEQDQG